MNTPSFHKSLRLLGHPLALAAMLVMAANDLLLKPLAPSWLSGKLSDLAALFLAPLLLASLITLAVTCLGERRPVPGSGRAAGWATGLAFGLPGLLFCAVKLSPGLAAALGQAAFSITGLSLFLTPDPTDLLALPALLASAWLWRRTPALPEESPAVTGSAPATRRAGWRLALLPLAALLCLADAAAPDYGIVCLSASGGMLTAQSQFSGYGSFESRDGGLSWQAATTPTDTQPGCTVNAGVALSQYKNDADGSQVRFTQGSVERSTDGGATWQVEFHLPAPSEQEAYYRQLLSPTINEIPVPISAATDPQTGNLVFAMGHQGVLVRLSSGEWRRVAVSERYRPAILAEAGLNGIGQMVADRLPFLPVVFLLGLASLLYLGAGGRFAAIQLGLLWVWLGILVLADLQGYLEVGVLFSLPAIAVWSLGLLAWRLFKRSQRPLTRSAWWALPAAAAAALLFMLPYLAWASSLFAPRLLAHALALALAAAVLVLAGAWLGKRIHIAG